MVTYDVTHVAIKYHGILRMQKEKLLMALRVGLRITALMDELFFRSGFKLIIISKKCRLLPINFRSLAFFSASTYEKKKSLKEVGI